MTIELGDRVRDRITGYTGLAYGRTSYLIGCNHVGVRSEELGTDGKPAELQWFDEPQLEVVVRGVLPTSSFEITPDKSGGIALHSFGRN